MSTFLGQLAIAANAPATFDAPNDGVKAILIGNESGLTSIVTMEGGGVQKTLYPSTVDWFTVNKGFTGKIKINPIIVLNNSGSWPSSSLVFDAIGINDHENVTMYPLALGRNTNIGNSVQTSSVQTLSNENSILGTKIVDIGSLTISDLFDIFNDHFVFKVQQGGVAHTVLQGNTAGNPLSIGQAGDISEVLGALTVDQASVLSGAVTAPGANVLGAVGVLTHLLGTLTVDQATSLVGALTATNTGNNVLLGTGVNIQGASLGFVSGGDTLGITTAGGGRVDPHLKAGATGGSASAGWLESEGVQVSSWDVNSALKCKNNKPIVFNFGSVASIGFGAFTPGSGISAINHNFGFVPTIALWQGGQISNVNPGTTTAAIFNCAANSCSINNFAAVNGFLLYIKA